MALKKQISDKIEKVRLTAARVTASRPASINAMLIPKIVLLLIILCFLKNIIQR